VKSNQPGGKKASGPQERFSEKRSEIQDYSQEMAVMVT